MNIDTAAQRWLDLDPDDPAIASGPKGPSVLMPRVYWKIIVSLSPDKAATPVVDAFLVPQFDPSGAALPSQPLSATLPCDGCGNRKGHRAGV